MSSNASKIGRKAYAVLTGDLVGSTGLNVAELERARASVLDAITQISAWQVDLVVGQPEFFRGDSWQLLLGDARYFLRAAIYLRAALRRERRDLDTRIGIGLGKVTRIDAERISLSTGDAFIASGRQLDAMSGSIGFTVAMPETVRDRLGWLDPIAALCGAAMNNWSERQADIACRMLAPSAPRQIDVADDLAVSKQAISKTLVAIEFDAMLTALRWVEAFDWMLELNRPRPKMV